MSSKRTFFWLTFLILALFFAFVFCASLDESSPSPVIDCISFILALGLFIAGFKWLCIVLSRCFRLFHLNVHGLRLFSDSEASSKRRFSILTFVMLALYFVIGILAILEKSTSSPVIENIGVILALVFVITVLIWLCIFHYRCFKMCLNWIRKPSRSNPQPQPASSTASEQAQQSWTSKRPVPPPQFQDFSENQLFISYSRDDWQQARAICTLLEELNIPYWIDIQNVYSGQNYKKMIVQEIHQCDGVIFLSSKNSNTSPNVCKEISCACDEKKFIIPLKLDNTPYADEIRYDLSSVDYIDYVKDSRNGFPKLRKAILANLTKSGKEKISD